MEIIFYALTLLGSSSLGYALLRAGFPSTQSINRLNKIIYGYAIGSVVVVPAIITAWFFGVASFFLMIGIIFCLLFVIFITRRLSYGEEDNVPLIEEEKKKVFIPKKILTVEERENDEDIEEKVKVIIRQPVVKPAKIKEQIFKEKQPNVIDQLRKKTTAIENKKNKENREAALRKMKDFAKQIDAKKAKKDINEIDEDELNNLDEGF